MDHKEPTLPAAGSETAPGEDTVTCKTAQKVEPEPPVDGHNPASAWTGQYPPGSDEAPDAPH